jgi:hypothetical protein
MVDDLTTDSPAETAVASPDLAAVAPVAEAEGQSAPENWEPAFTQEVARDVPVSAGPTEATFTPPPTLEDRTPVGSTFTRTAFGWSVQIMYGGSLRLSGDGATMDNALKEAGV